MLTHIVVFILGLGILYLGADWLIDGASEVARKFGIRPMIIGLTIVALGTSLPEFLLNLFAVSAGQDGLAVGNIIGSNIANIALILGLSAVILPIAFDGEALKKEYPMMLAVTGLFYFLALDGSISRLDGFFLVAGLVAFIVFVIMTSSRDQIPVTTASDGQKDAFFVPQSGLKKWLHDEKTGPFVRILLIVAGMAALALGARFMVDSAINMAMILDINPTIVGLTIVGIGTSLPELAASLMAAVKKESDLSIGNILGSNMLNILFVIGVVSVIQPMSIDAESISFHMPIMIGFSLMLWPLARRKHQLSRFSGFILLASFLGYLGWLIYPFL